MYDKFRWTDVGRSRNAILWQYEPIQPFVFFEWCTAFKPTIFLDIGANIGTYSIFLSKQKSISKITAFEPDPMTFKELKDNIALNSLSNKILAVNCAVSDQEGSVEFVVVSNFSGASGIAATHAFAAEPIQERIVVAAVSLDKRCRALGERIAIKLDVEGHELQVLNGAHTLLSNNIVLLQVEVNNNRLAELQDVLSVIGIKYYYRIANDHYFSNEASLFDERSIVLNFDKALMNFIDHSRKFGGADLPLREEFIRQRIFPGVTVELSKRLSGKIRTLFGRSS